jgi:hypothetical protein
MIKLIISIIVGVIVAGRFRKGKNNDGRIYNSNSGNNRGTLCKGE